MNRSLALPPPIANSLISLLRRPIQMPDGDGSPYFFSPPHTIECLPILKAQLPRSTAANLRPIRCHCFESYWNASRPKSRPTCARARCRQTRSVAVQFCRLHSAALNAMSLRKPHSLRSDQAPDSTSTSIVFIPTSLGTESSSPLTAPKNQLSDFSVNCGARLLRHFSLTVSPPPRGVVSIPTPSTS